MHWPRRNPYNKRWFQRQIAKSMTARRFDRVQRMILEWEPRLWEAGVNVPNRLLLEARYLEGCIESGRSDWRAFPGWVKRWH